MFEYYADTFTTLSHLRVELTTRGTEGWRLHTCDIIGGEIFIVMDRFIAGDVESENKEEKDEAMECKG